MFRRNSTARPSCAQTSASQLPAAQPLAAAVSVGLMLAGLALAACQTTTTTRPPDLNPRAVVERGRWQVHGPNGSPAGTLVRYEILDPAEPQTFYRVEDMGGHWVGYAGANGWFTRLVPFQDQPQDMGLYPMEEGVARLLGVPGHVELVPGAWEGEEIPAAPQPATIRRLDGGSPAETIPWR